MRVAKADKELCDMLDSAIEDFNGDEAAETVHRKYDLPESVFLFGHDSIFPKNVSSIYKKHLSAFVKGKLTESDVKDLIFSFENIDECDYGWILLERPMGFYGVGGGLILEKHREAIRSEILAIGTRSSNKIRNLPLIAGDFSQSKVGAI